MSKLTGTQEQIGFLKGKAAQAAGNYYARLGRREIALEEYQQALSAYNSVHQTLPDFVEAQKIIDCRQKTKFLAETWFFSHDFFERAFFSEIQERLHNKVFCL
ncbi:MAG: hypothetical protein DRR19_15380 [Candidatus Parabeggiatoa sp. nov. 1]|nr:MAG: hypothetical protein DRR19_15380 [Gammaproteobacteria bacterium]